MFDALRASIQAYLDAHDCCVVMTAGAAGVSALLVCYRARRLGLECPLPRWAEVTYALEQDPRIVLVVPPVNRDKGRWLHVQGMAELVPAPNWDALPVQKPVLAAPAELYQVIRVRPRRIDLFDERRGWGSRETLELS